MKALASTLDLKKKVINDMSFDWYGSKLAVVVEFSQIFILTVTEKQNEAKIIFNSKIFDFGILKLKWSHPVNGSILAASTSIREVFLIYRQIINNSNIFDL